MSPTTEEWLHGQFDSYAEQVQPPAELRQRTLDRARHARSQRRVTQGTLTAALAVVATGVVLVSAGVFTNSAEPKPASPRPVPTPWTFDLYFVDMPPLAAGESQSPVLVTEPVTVPNTGDKPTDVMNALLTTTNTSGTHVNGFDMFSHDEGPIAWANSVTVGQDLITVDLDRSVWDPYPSVDCDCPSGSIVMQQLVWTLDSSLETDLPVELTINGEPARGIWMHPLDGPVEADPAALHQGSSSLGEFDQPGIKAEPDAPAPSIMFVTTNAWMGWYKGHYVAVYAGTDGYEHPNVGEVLVRVYGDNRNNPLDFTRTLSGSGALKVVDVDRPLVTLVDENGERHELNLATQELN